MTKDKTLLLEVLCEAFDLIIDMMDSGAEGGQINGRGHNEYFIFHRMPDGLIDYGFM